MLENGNKNRTQHPTDANAESSRSHAVFQVMSFQSCLKRKQNHKLLMLNHSKLQHNPTMYVGMSYMLEHAFAYPL